MDNILSDTATADGLVTQIQPPPAPAWAAARQRNPRCRREGCSLVRQPGIARGIIDDFQRRSIGGKKSCAPLPEWQGLVHAAPTHPWLAEAAPNSCGGPPFIGQPRQHAIDHACDHLLTLLWRHVLGSFDIGGRRPACTGRRRQLVGVARRKSAPVRAARREFLPAMARQVR